MRAHRIVCFALAGCSKTVTFEGQSTLPVTGTSSRVQDHPKRRLDELLPGPWARASAIA